MDKETEGKDFVTGEDESFSVEDHDQDPTHTKEGQLQPNYVRLVTPDPAAFRYLEEDPTTTVLERRRRLHGYELFFVEQWGCSRVHPTFCITTYTGLEQHSVVVGVLSIPTDEEVWSPRLRVYLKAITKYHARKKETPLGFLMVTNLSSFPSALTVIPVPDGDIKKHREDFVVNENLKRLGCSGRAGLNIAVPTAATRTKFVQSYHTSDQIPIYGAVIELVKLCQVALIFFDKLAPEYADGLLCDVTETAINEWWSGVGSDIFNIDPSDGILGPTTVAALLGLLMGARKRLSAFGAPVAKDVFDLAGTKRAIAYFQKSQKLKRTRRLDRDTLDRLHKVTAKAASGEGWTMPRAVKSTVAELKGKGEKMVDGREKGRIAEVESLDMNTFVQLGSGERFKWLWHGKPRKTNETEVFGSTGTFGSAAGDDGWIFNDEQEGPSWSNKRKDSVDDETSLRHTISDRVFPGHSHSSQTSVDHTDKEKALRKAVLKNASSKTTDSRSGFGRFRDAVGRRGRGHQHKYSTDDAVLSNETSARNSEDLRRSFDMPFNVSQLEKYLTDSGEPSTSVSADASREKIKAPEEENIVDNGASHQSSYSDLGEDLEIPVTGIASSRPRSDYMDLIDNANGITSRNREHEDMDDLRHRNQLVNDTQAIKKMEHFDWASSKLAPLRSTRSVSHLTDKVNNLCWERRWARHMSFTAMVDVVAASQPHPLTNEDNTIASKDPDTALAFENALATQNRVMESRLQRLKTLEAPWVEAKLAQIEAYDQQCGRDQSNLDMVYHHKTEENNALQDASEELLTQERAALTEANKDIETLGAKLEYELSALQSKVEDVEDGVEEFERQVGLIEARVKEQLLEDREDGRPQDRWMGWFFGRSSS